MKITLDLDADLYRAVKVEAARMDRSIRAVFEAALVAWLEALEAAEDAAGAAEAMAEYEGQGGEPAEEFFRVHAAETRAAYGEPDPA